MYELSEAGFGTIEHIKSMRMYDFFDLMQYVRIKQAEIKKQQDKQNKKR